MNSAGMPYFLGILLARECGRTKPEINLAIERMSRFFAYYCGRGAVPYGEHEAFWQGHENNGKSGLAALSFTLEPGRVVESGDARAVLDHPQHPYSILLKDSDLSVETVGDGILGAVRADAPEHPHQGESIARARP